MKKTTRDALHKHFRDKFKYTDEQIEQAIWQLAEHDDTINPEASEFPSSIVEQLESVFQTCEQALQDLNNSLGVEGKINPAALAEAKDKAVTISKEKGLDLSPQILEQYLYILAERGIARAVLQHQIEDVFYTQAKSTLDVSRLEKERELNTKQLQALQLILGDETKIDEVLAAYGVKSEEENQEWLSSYQAETEDDDDFDPSQFITQLTSEDVVTGSKKLNLLNTKKSQKLIKSLYAQVLG